MKKSQRKKANFGIRAAALLTLLCFSVTDVLWADGASLLNSFSDYKSISLQPHGTVSTVTPAGAVSVLPILPRELGEIKETFRGKNHKRSVILVQDAHANEEAQQNIAGIIEFLSEQKNLKRVYLEGANGELDTTLYDFFPDISAKRLIADYYLREARLTGPEYYSLMRGDGNTRLVGVEDRALYDENRQAYLNALQFKDRDQATLESLGKALRDLSRFILPAEAMELQKHQAALQERGEGLDDYITFLFLKAADSGIDTSAFPQMTAFMKVSELSRGIDFKSVKKKLKTISNDFASILKPADRDIIWSSTVKYHLGQIDGAEYFPLLLNTLTTAMNTSDLAETKRLREQHADLLSYLEFMHLQTALNAGIFEEFKILETELKTGWLLTEEQRELDRLWTIHSVMSKLFNFSLTKQDADFYYANRKEFAAETFASFMNPRLKTHHFSYGLPEHIDLLDKDMTEIEKFYKAAIKRDKVLIENTIRDMEQADIDTAVLVTGGFHTSGIMSQLRDSGYSYAVVIPRIRAAIDWKKENELYENALREAPLELEEKIIDAHFASSSSSANDPRFQLASAKMFLPEDDWRKISSILSSSANAGAEIASNPEWALALDFVTRLMTSTAFQSRDPLRLWNRILAESSASEFYPGVLRALFEGSEILRDARGIQYFVYPGAGREKIPVIAQASRDVRAGYMKDVLGAQSFSGGKVEMAPDRIWYVSSPESYQLERLRSEAVQRFAFAESGASDAAFAENESVSDRPLNRSDLRVFPADVPGMNPRTVLAAERDFERLKKVFKGSLLLEFTPAEQNAVVHYLASTEEQLNAEAPAAEIVPLRDDSLTAKGIDYSPRVLGWLSENASIINTSRSGIRESIGLFRAEYMRLTRNVIRRVQETPMLNENHIKAAADFLMHYLLTKYNADESGLTLDDLWGIDPVQGVNRFLRDVGVKGISDNAVVYNLETVNLLKDVAAQRIFPDDVNVDAVLEQQSLYSGPTEEERAAVGKVFIGEPSGWVSEELEDTVAQLERQEIETGKPAGLRVVMGTIAAQERSFWRWLGGLFKYIFGSWEQSNAYHSSKSYTPGLHLAALGDGSEWPLEERIALSPFGGAMERPTAIVRTYDQTSAPVEQRAAPPLSAEISLQSGIGVIALDFKTVDVPFSHVDFEAADELMEAGVYVGKQYEPSFLLPDENVTQEDRDLALFVLEGGTLRGSESAAAFGISEGPVVRNNIVDLVRGADRVGAIALLQDAIDPNIVTDEAVRQQNEGYISALLPRFYDAGDGNGFGLRSEALDLTGANLPITQDLIATLQTNAPEIRIIAGFLAGPHATNDVLPAGSPAAVLRQAMADDTEGVLSGQINNFLVRLRVSPTGQVIAFDVNGDGSPDNDVPFVAADTIAGAFSFFFDTNEQTELLTEYLIIPPDSGSTAPLNRYVKLLSNEATSGFPSFFGQRVRFKNDELTITYDPDGNGIPEAGEEVLSQDLEDFIGLVKFLKTDPRADLYVRFFEAADASAESGSFARYSALLADAETSGFPSFFGQRTEFRGGKFVITYDSNGDGAVTAGEGVTAQSFSDFLVFLDFLDSDPRAELYVEFFEAANDPARSDAFGRYAALFAGSETSGFPSFFGQRIEVRNGNLVFNFDPNGDGNPEAGEQVLRQDLDNFLAGLNFIKTNPQADVYVDFFAAAASSSTDPFSRYARLLANADTAGFPSFFGQRLQVRGNSLVFNFDPDGDGVPLPGEPVQTQTLSNFVGILNFLKTDPGAAAYVDFLEAASSGASTPLGRYARLLGDPGTAGFLSFFGQRLQLRNGALVFNYDPNGDGVPEPGEQVVEQTMSDFLGLVNFLKTDSRADLYVQFLEGVGDPSRADALSRYSRLLGAAETSGFPSFFGQRVTVQNGVPGFNFDPNGDRVAESTEQVLEQTFDDFLVLLDFLRSDPDASLYVDFFSGENLPEDLSLLRQSFSDENISGFPSFFLQRVNVLGGRLVFNFDQNADGQVSAADQVLFQNFGNFTAALRFFRDGGPQASYAARFLSGLQLGGPLGELRRTFDQTGLPSFFLFRMNPDGTFNLNESGAQLDVGRFAGALDYLRENPETTRTFVNFLSGNIQGPASILRTTFLSDTSGRDPGFILYYLSRIQPDGSLSLSAAEPVVTAESLSQALDYFAVPVRVVNGEPQYRPFAYEITAFLTNHVSGPAQILREALIQSADADGGRTAGFIFSFLQRLQRVDGEMKVVFDTDGNGVLNDADNQVSSLPLSRLGDALNFFYRREEGAHELGDFLAENLPAGSPIQAVRNAILLNPERGAVTQFFLFRLFDYPNPNQIYPFNRGNTSGIDLVFDANLNGILLESGQPAFQLADAGAEIVPETGDLNLLKRSVSQLAQGLNYFTNAANAEDAKLIEAFINGGGDIVVPGGGLDLLIQEIFADTTGKVSGFIINRLAEMAWELGGRKWDGAPEGLDPFDRTHVPLDLFAQVLRSFNSDDPAVVQKARDLIDEAKGQNQTKKSAIYSFFGIPTNNLVGGGGGGGGSGGSSSSGGGGSSGGYAGGAQIRFPGIVTYTPERWRDQERPPSDVERIVVSESVFENIQIQIIMEQDGATKTFSVKLMIDGKEVGLRVITQIPSNENFDLHVGSGNFNDNGIIEEAPSAHGENLVLIRLYSNTHPDRVWFIVYDRDTGEILAVVEGTPETVVTEEGDILIIRNGQTESRFNIRRAKAAQVPAVPQVPEAPMPAPQEANQPVVPPAPEIVAQLPAPEDQVAQREAADQVFEEMAEGAEEEDNFCEWCLAVAGVTVGAAAVATGIYAYSRSKKKAEEPDELDDLPLSIIDDVSGTDAADALFGDLDTWRSDLRSDEGRDFLLNRRQAMGGMIAALTGFFAGSMTGFGQEAKGGAPAGLQALFEPYKREIAAMISRRTGRAFPAANVRINQDNFLTAFRQSIGRAPSEVARVDLEHVPQNAPTNHRAAMTLIFGDILEMPLNPSGDFSATDWEVQFLNPMMQVFGFKGNRAKENEFVRLLAGNLREVKSRLLRWQSAGMITQDSDIPSPMEIWASGALKIDQWAELNRTWRNNRWHPKFDLETILGIAIFLTRQEMERLTLVRVAPGIQRYLNRDFFYGALESSLNTSSITVRNRINRGEFTSVVGNFFLNPAFGETLDELSSRSPLRGLPGAGADELRRSMEILAVMLGGLDRQELQRAAFAQLRPGPHPQLTRDTAHEVDQMDIAGVIFPFLVASKAFWVSPDADVRQIINPQNFNAILEAYTAVERSNVVDQVYLPYDNPAIVQILNDWKAGKFRLRNGLPEFPEVYDIRRYNVANFDYSSAPPGTRRKLLDMLDLARRLGAQDASLGRHMNYQIIRELLKIAVMTDVNRKLFWIRYGVETGLVRITRNQGRVTVNISGLLQKMRNLRDLTHFVNIYAGRTLNLNASSDMGFLSSMETDMRRKNMTPPHYSFLLFMASNREHRTNLQNLLRHLTGDARWEQGFDFLNPATGPVQSGFVLEVTRNLGAEGWDVAKIARMAEFVRTSGRDNIFRVGNEFWGAFASVMGQTVPRFEGNFLNWSAQTQGRMMAFISEGATKGWVQIAAESAGVKRFFDETRTTDAGNGNHARRDAILQAADRLHRALIGPARARDADYLPLTPERVLTNSRAQGVFLSWALQQAQTLGYVDAARKQLEGAKRSDLRAPEETETTLAPEEPSVTELETTAEEDLLAALPGGVSNASQEFYLQSELTALEGQAGEMELDLIDAMLNLSQALDNAFVRSGYAQNSGLYVLEWQKHHDVAFLADLMVRMGKGVHVVIWADPLEMSSETRGFARAMGIQLEMKTSGQSLENFVLELIRSPEIMKLLGKEVTSLTQIVTGDQIARQRQGALDASLLSAAEISQGRLIVAGGDRALQMRGVQVQVFGLVELLAIAIEANEAIGTSA